MQFKLIDGAMSDMLWQMVLVARDHGNVAGFFQMSQDTMRQYQDPPPAHFKDIPIYYSDRFPLDYVVLSKPGDEVYE